MRLALVVGAILALFLVAPGCQHAPPNLTPKAQAAYTADQVIARIGEFQQVVIDSTKLNVIKLADAREIVEWTTTALTIVHGTPNGYQAALKDGYPQVRALAVTYRALGDYIPILDGIVGYVPTP